jgi:hypothetical protein
MRLSQAREMAASAAGTIMRIIMDFMGGCSVITNYFI